MSYLNQYIILSSNEMSVFNVVRQTRERTSYLAFYVYIKMFMDVVTFISGINRRFCFSDFEQEFGFSRFKVDRTIKGLEKIGLINYLLNILVVHALNKIKTAYIFIPLRHNTGLNHTI